MERLQRVGHHLTVPAGVAADAELPRDVLAPESSAALVDTSGKAINQRFQVSRAEGAKWGDGLRPYFQYRDLGIQRATSDQFRALLLRVREEDSHGGPIEMGQHTTGLHYHDVDFQMVVVVQGWMRFVFEGQGEHRFEAGDAWLQPARITHNELECSDDLIAFEIVTPGVHKTVALDDLAGSPPTAQRFHVSKASEREFKDGLRPYFEYGDLGMSEATNGAFKAHMIRVKGSEGGTNSGQIEMGKPTTEHTTGLHTHGVDFQMNFILQGWMRFEFHVEGVEGGSEVHTFHAGDCWLQPPGIVHNELACSDDLLNMEICSPAAFATTPIDSAMAHRAMAKAAAVSGGGR